MGFPREAQLTAAGVQQMYEYGQFMRQRYHAYFENGERSSSQRIRVISSATDRTISSAQALIAGLLPPNGTQRQWNTTLGLYWNPFPVYSRPSTHDGLLLNFKDDCPEFTKLRDSIDTLPIARQLQEEMKVRWTPSLLQQYLTLFQLFLFRRVYSYCIDWLIDYYTTNATGTNCGAVKMVIISDFAWKDFTRDIAKATGLNDKYDFFDTSTAIEDAIHYRRTHPQLFINAPPSKSWPPWMNTTLADDLKRIADMRMHLMVGGNGDRIRTRFRAGNLLHDIFDRMFEASRNPGTNYLKMVQYSGVSTNNHAKLHNYSLQSTEKRKLRDILLLFLL